MKGAVVVVFLVVVVSAAAAAASSEPQCKAEPGLWNNLVSNLNEMFWAPFLARYSVVRYALEEHPLHGALTEGIGGRGWSSSSCDAMELISFAAVVCVQQAAWGLGRWPCAALAGPKLSAALATLDECPQQTLESDAALVRGLNRTLQRRQHCYYATAALRCSLLQLYWVLPYGLAALVLALPALLIACGGLGVAWCCSAGRSDGNE